MSIIYITLTKSHIQLGRKVSFYVKRIFCEKTKKIYKLLVYISDAVSRRMKSAKTLETVNENAFDIAISSYFGPVIH